MNAEEAYDIATTYNQKKYEETRDRETLLHINLITQIISEAARTGKYIATCKLSAYCRCENIANHFHAKRFAVSFEKFLDDTICTIDFSKRGVLDGKDNPPATN